MPETAYNPDPRATTDVFLSRRYKCDCQSAAASSPMDGLIHYWTLDESAGSQRFDSIGSLHLSEISGLVPSVVGKNNSASQVEISHLDSASWILTFPFSVSVWLKFDSHLLDGWTIAKKSGAVNPTWLFSMSDTDKPSFINGVGGGASFGSAISIGSYHLLIGTYDGNVFQISVDGSPLLTSAPGSYDGGSGAISLVDDSSSFLHELDELAIWNRVLSQSDVASIWNSGNGLFLS